jgi:tetratricopeptide (TPR) repeat protein
MKYLALVVCLFLVGTAIADDQEKDQKKALELQAKQLVTQAKDAEKSGDLLEARSLYASSQAFWETKDADSAIKRIDGEIHQKVKDALRQAHTLYDAGKYKEAAQQLEDIAKLNDMASAVSYNLALCYYRLGDTAMAIGYLDQAIVATPDPKKRVKLQELRTGFVTGEKIQAIGDNGAKERIVAVNSLVLNVGFESSLEEDPAPPEPRPQTADPAPNGTVGVQEAALVPVAASSPAPVLSSSSTASSGNKTNRKSLCEALDALKSQPNPSPALAFDRANCAEDNGRLADSAQLLRQYTELSPKAADIELVRLRIADLTALANLPEPQGSQVRGLYASAARAMAEGKYDVALADFNRASTVAPNLASNEWRLGLMYEAMADVQLARAHFEKFKELAADPGARDEADLHLATLQAKRDDYDQEVTEAEDIVADLINRDMDLTWNGMENRSALYKDVMKQKMKGAKGKKNKIQLMGGFGVPHGYAQQQLADAGDHLQTALGLFPLGAEANELIAFVYLQANDGRSAMRAFDAASAQGAPVFFYAELRGKKQDRAVKVELTHNSVQIVYLSFYGRGGQPIPPAISAGQDGLGDLLIDPHATRKTNFERMSIAPADIKRVETKNGELQLKLQKEDLALLPIFMPAATPVDGPAGRRFANNYTRLFVRYPGLEDSKLGAEGLTTYEKMKLAYDIANAGMTMAFSMNPMGSISALQAFIKISAEINGVAQSLQVNYAGWERTIEDQRALQEGSAFKAIPTEPVTLTYVEN